MKLADDGSGDLIVRLYEALRRPGPPVTVRCRQRIVDAWRCNLLEEAQAPHRRRPTASSRITLRPFELVTLRLRLTSAPTVGRAPTERCRVRGGGARWRRAMAA